MKIKKYYIILILSLFNAFVSYLDDIEFESSNMDIKNNVNLIIAYETEIKIPAKKIFIKSTIATYDKVKNVITLKRCILWR